MGLILEVVKIIKFGAHGQINAKRLLVMLWIELDRWSLIHVESTEFVLIKLKCSYRQVFNVFYFFGQVYHDLNELFALLVPFSLVLW